MVASGLSGFKRKSPAESVARSKEIVCQRAKHGSEHCAACAGLPSTPSVLAALVIFSANAVAWRLSDRGHLRSEGIERYPPQPVAMKMPGAGHRMSQTCLDKPLRMLMGVATGATMLYVANAACGPRPHDWCPLFGHELNCSWQFVHLPLYKCVQ